VTKETTVTFATWQVGQLLWSMLWFFLLFMLIWLVISVFVDIFRSPDLSGWSKALWTVFVVFLPWFGVFVYLLARGGTMADRRARTSRSSASTWGYGVPVYDSAASYGPPVVSSPAGDLTALADLHSRGVIDEAEFRSMKQRVVAP
jgi:hypothetical protein